MGDLEKLMSEIDSLSDSLSTIRKAFHLIKTGKLEEAVSVIEEKETVIALKLFPLAMSIKGAVLSALEKHERASACYLDARKASDFNSMNFRALLINEYKHFHPEGIYGETIGILDSPFVLNENLANLNEYVAGYKKKWLDHSNETAEKAKLWYNYHIPFLKEKGMSLRGKDVLEIGGGVIPFTSLMYVLMGANVTAIDKYRSPDFVSIIGPHGQMISYGRLIEKYYDEVLHGEIGADEKRLTVDDIVKLEDDRIKIVAPNLKFLSNVDSGGTNLESESYDFIFSLDVLEHVGDPEGDPMDTVKEIARLLRPGGWTAHRFGPIDHRDTDNRPYDSFCLSEQEWKSLDIPHNQRTNRWVLSRWREAFRSVGLEEVLMLPNACTEIIPPLKDEKIATFHPDFKNLDRQDLETLVMVMILRKPE